MKKIISLMIVMSALSIQAVQAGGISSGTPIPKLVGGTGSAILYGLNLEDQSTACKAGTSPQAAQALASAQADAKNQCADFTQVIDLDKNSFSSVANPDTEAGRTANCVAQVVFECWN